MRSESETHSESRVTFLEIRWASGSTQLRASPTLASCLQGVRANCTLMACSTFRISAPEIGPITFRSRSLLLTKPRCPEQERSGPSHRQANSSEELLES